MIDGARLFLLHGYSDRASSFEAWKGALVGAGFDSERIYIAGFRTLSNELRIADIAEALESEITRVLGDSADVPLSFITHSTGMLVVREWLRLFPQRRSQTRHLIGLAPANFGSPLAHRGRSWLGSALKGNREWGPDFLEAGNQILQELEVGSEFLWDLAHCDLVGRTSLFRTGTGPCLSVFCGDSPYTGLRKAVNPIASDGTVRFAGASARARKAVLDLTAEGNRRRKARSRFFVEELPETIYPPFKAAGLNHATILTAPSTELVADVTKLLTLESAADIRDWARVRAQRDYDDDQEIAGRTWMQLVVRAIDDRGARVPDFILDLVGIRADGSEVVLQEPSLELHRNGAMSSCLALHIDTRWISDLRRDPKFRRLELRVIASSGTPRIGYFGFGSTRLAATTRKSEEEGTWDAVVDVTGLATKSSIAFFAPMVTTLMEVRLDRQPLPVGSGLEVLTL